VSERLTVEQVRADEVDEGQELLREKSLWVVEVSARSQGEHYFQLRDAGTGAKERVWTIPWARYWRVAPSPRTLEADCDSYGPFDPDELVRWAQTYGDPEWEGFNGDDEGHKVPAGPKDEPCWLRCPFCCFDHTDTWICPNGGHRNALTEATCYLCGDASRRPEPILSAFDALRAVAAASTQWFTAEEIDVEDLFDRGILAAGRDFTGEGTTSLTTDAIKQIQALLAAAPVPAAEATDEKL
jgi:hypothetical protein